MASFDAKAPPKNRWVVQPAHLGKDTIVHYHAAGGDAAALGHALRRNGGDASGGGLAHFYSPPVHLASAYGHLACVALLLERGATVGADDARRGGATPLHLAALGGHAAVAEVLLDAGCDLAAHSGELALHAAARGNRPRVVEALVQHESSGAGVKELPGVIERLSEPLARGSLFTRPYQHAYSSGSRACAAPIEAVVRDCKAQIYPGGAGGGPKAWGREIDATPAAPKLEPPPKVKPPVDHNATARAARSDAPVVLLDTKRWLSSAENGDFGQGRCRLCDPVAQDARGHRCNTTHSTEQHYAWADVTRAETRKARIKHQRERKEGRLAPGEVPWRSW
ncbi:hypothetical protein JL720_9532 [Aureococcus anophagefferens]|nr:hypothetical protein JL720_9532 [Aureococcus anophagefferens]